MSELMLERDVAADLLVTGSREWLVTNGLGGYASGTVSGMTTRRYHGLLVAALRPPVERTAMVAKIDAIVTCRGQVWQLGTNEYADGTLNPRGSAFIDSFRLEGQIPVWLWRIGDGLLEQRIWMAHGANTTYVSYTLLRGSDSVDLELAPLCTYRDYHWQHRGYRDTRVEAKGRGAVVHAHDGARPFELHIERGDCSIGPEWHWNLRHRVESERGLDDLEDLVCPAKFRCRLKQGESTTLILTAETMQPVSAAVALQAARQRQQKLLRLAGATDGAEDAGGLSRSQLVLAADQFIVERHDQAGMKLGETIIAGYPWFSDWGRDTMIALPGLTLATGRADIAASILRTFAHFVSDGMLPNRFPDGGEPPEYNTVDATLWYVVAVDETLRRTQDAALLAALYPVLREIVDWHQRGTRFGIRVDERDGLLAAGEPGVQLTWMDAKIGDWVVTPRMGKPVEINALWFNALVAMRDFAMQLDLPADSRAYAAAAAGVAQQFNRRFWCEEGGYLYDVIDTPLHQPQVDSKGCDASVRPNQILAVSLRHQLLDHERARSVVDVCARELWTPVGLRSLSKGDSRYAGRYEGGPAARDAVYHQGTVWSWLLGPFATAHYRVYRDARVARSYLSDGNAHLREACIGQVSEIFDGDSPHTARGCFAQAWGVAETLKAWSDIDENESRSDRIRADGRAA